MPASDTVRLCAYLTFDGNCREAMTFYRNCLGGELQWQTVGDSPGSGRLPDSMKNCIVQATLITGNWMLLGSDLPGEMRRRVGNSVSLSLHGAAIDTLRRYFDRLAEGGFVHRNFTQNHYGHWIGELTDAYGHHWLLYGTEKDNGAK